MLYAHSIQGEAEEQWQSLSDHLERVANLSAEFASPFGAENWAYLSGITHDAGKASESFQRRLHGSAEQVDHATAGAQLLAQRYGPVGRQLSYLVAGHHGGLPNGTDASGERSSLKERLAKSVDSYDRLFSAIDLPDAAGIYASIPSLLKDCDSERRATFAFSFLMRMLYSSLVDADFLDTERVIDPSHANLRAQALKTLPEMRELLNARMDAMGEGAQTPVNQARADIHRACVDAAAGRPGLYSLTVPTGGGKTLASLAFALSHAIANGQERIIYAIPFTSIVEQTASTFKSIFGSESVLEHHSNYGFSDAEESDGDGFWRERLAMENWDVPLVVTTNVQLFESLYSDKPSRCRRNHNVTNSVIILDEAQSLPDGFLKPCLAALEELSQHYSTTTVLCTATQPALGSVWPFQSSPVEIVPEAHRHSDLFDQRVDIRYVGEKCLDDITEEMTQQRQALCVVSTRGAAGQIFDNLLNKSGNDGVYHLSAMMVPKHRSAVLEEIRKRLRDGLPCRVVSTQLIEAGVDVDFPIVMREVAGIDSIKQAAGRCNREGKAKKGNVIVFECPETAVSGHSWLSRMRTLGLETIELQSEPFDDDGVSAFFASRYQVEDTDSAGILDDFCDSQHLEGLNFSFERCGEQCRFVDDAGVSVFVPWGDQGMALLDSIRKGSLDIRQARAIQGYTVSVPIYAMKKIEAESALVRYPPYLVLEPSVGMKCFYSGEKGLTWEDGDAALVV